MKWESGPGWFAHSHTNGRLEEHQGPQPQSARGSPWAAIINNDCTRRGRENLIIGLSIYLSDKCFSVTGRVMYTFPRNLSEKNDTQRPRKKPAKRSTVSALNQEMPFHTRGSVHSMKNKQMAGKNGVGELRDVFFLSLPLALLPSEERFSHRR